MTEFYPGSLHNHTQYSNLRLRDCIIKEDDLIKYAVELGHEVVAITDHEAVCNAVKVEKIYKKIKKDNPNFKVIWNISSFAEIIDSFFALSAFFIASSRI